METYCRNNNKRVQVMIFDSHHNHPDSTNIKGWSRNIIFKKKSKANIVINDVYSFKIKINGENKFGDGKLCIVIKYAKSSEVHVVNFGSLNSEKIIEYSFDNSKGPVSSITIEKKYNSIGSVQLNRVQIERTSSKNVFHSERRVNVAIIVPYSIYGGGEIYIKSLIDSDKLNGFNFHFIYPKDNSLSRNISRDNVFHHRKFNLVNMKKFFIINKISCVIFYNSIKIYKALKNIQTEYSFKLFEIYHSDFKWGDSMAHIREHNVDCLIKVDENVGKGIECDNVEICRVPIDVDKFKPKSKKFAIHAFGLTRSNCIGVISRISKEKNLEYILSLAKSMKDFNFFIVGDGVGRKSLQILIDKDKISNVKILGWISDVSKIINGFDSIILPSKMEGTPISILEAMSSNVKAWCYNVGGNKTLIENGAMELSLSEFIDDFNIREYMNSEADTRGYIYESHNKDKCVADFLNILDKNLYLLSEKLEGEMSPLRGSMHNIVFRGLPGENSGYGDATTFFALSFYKYDKNTNYCFDPFDHYSEKVKRSLQDKYSEFSKMRESKIEDVVGRVVFTIGTPKPALRPGANYNILYFYWETDTIPKRWVHFINQYDEIWAPCSLVKDALKKSGFTGVVILVPTPNLNSNKYSKFVIPHKKSKDLKVSDNVFKFYYIFQWQYRKGYDSLIKAYYDAFSGNDNVLLILKTNKLSGTNEEFVGNISKEIDSFKKGRGNLPEIFIIPNFISNEKISYLHKISDVYVAPNRGEGWGMPIVKAVNEDSLIITTKFGGSAEFLDENSAMIINHKKASVKNMNWSGHLYTADHNWAEPRVDHLSSLMVEAYSNFKKYENLKKNALRNFSKFDIENVSKIIRNQLNSKRFVKWK